jgi:hypothetical protein|tara:strand:+ start:1483 stop:1674 length:192 start_codon:yes stop_codon:yes gene_type:complete
MDELYREFERITINKDPLMVAGVMMAQALQIYKTMLDKKEFNLMTEHILKSRDEIEIDTPTLN